MPARSHTLWLVRRGHTADEYEDASAAEDEAGRFAVADGATEGCFTGLWARLLVDGFVNHRGEEVEDWLNSLPALQERWDLSVCGPELPWYAEEGIRQGAFAAFLGLVLATRPRGRYQWQAIAVGDTCLFHTRRNTLLRAFPLERAADFDNLPKLVGSRSPLEAAHARQTVWTEGRGRHGDRLWMMTDALAQWCLGEVEAGRSPWSHLHSFLTSPEGEEVFALWIEGLRNGDQLRNDDVTLLAIQL